MRGQARRQRHGVAPVKGYEARVGCADEGGASIANDALCSASYQIAGGSAGGSSRSRRRGRTVVRPSATRVPLLAGGRHRPRSRDRRLTAPSIAASVSPGQLACPQAPSYSSGYAGRTCGTRTKRVDGGPALARARSPVLRPQSALASRARFRGLRARLQSFACKAPELCGRGKKPCARGSGARARSSAL